MSLGGNTTPSGGLFTSSGSAVGVDTSPLVPDAAILSSIASEQQLRVECFSQRRGYLDAARRLAHERAS